MEEGKSTSSVPSWSAIVQKEPVSNVSGEKIPTENKPRKRIVVIDANSIIKG